ncbi:hypothetical protein ACNFG0_15370 [Pseudomonas sp. NY15372]
MKERITVPKMAFQQCRGVKSDNGQAMNQCGRKKKNPAEAGFSLQH